MMAAPRSPYARVAKADSARMSRLRKAPNDVSGWVEYVTWSRVLWGVILFGPVAAVALSVAFTGSDRIMLPLLAWLLAAALAGYRLQRVRCPRCEHRFFRQRPLLLGLIANRCAVCMLPKA